MDSGACASITSGILNFRLFHLLSRRASSTLRLGANKAGCLLGCPIPQSLVEQAKKTARGGWFAALADLIGRSAPAVLFAWLSPADRRSLACAWSRPQKASMMSFLINVSIRLDPLKLTAQAVNSLTGLSICCICCCNCMTCGFCPVT